MKEDNDSLRSDSYASHIKMYDIKPPTRDGSFVSAGNDSKTEFASIDLEKEDKFKAQFTSDKPIERDVDIDISKNVYNSKIQEEVETERIKREFSSVPYDEPKGNASRQLKNRGFNFKKLFFFIFSFLVILAIAAAFLFIKGSEAKDNIIKNSASAYESILKAQNNIEDLNFKEAGFEFNEAHRKFTEAQKEAESAGAVFLNYFTWMPFLADVRSKVYLIDVGVDISHAGASLSRAVEPLFKISSRSIFLAEDEVVTKENFGGFLASVVSGIESSKESLDDAEKKLEKIDPHDFPEEFQDDVFNLKKRFPEIKQKVSELSEYSDFAMWLLGEDNPKNFLIVSQNTSEARATGGFIGSYGLLKSEFGYVRDIFMDDIYSLDGQLSYKAVPPKPIQKISTAWSTHDANWFLDFPTSAKKIAFFYEKAGGPTPDGVIAINQKVLEDILRVVGPIEMKDYDIVIDANNFVDTVQYKVEEDYDKEQNKPKKILDDMVPLLFEKFATLSQDELMRLFNVFISDLKEKNILFWANKQKYQDFVIRKGWAGEILQKERVDYLAVVNSNINGYKTDRVVKQNIVKTTEVQSDGSIVSTVKVKRIHEGGEEEYEWLNKVNADYLRVYVPLGSELLDAYGHTVEEYKAPIDYDAEAFNYDQDVLRSENSMRVDEKTKTHIFEESGKTVFGNWVFVSPKEEVEVVYKYRLPFKLDDFTVKNDLETIFQVQPGSDSNLSFITVLPESWKFTGSMPERSFGKYIGRFSEDKFFKVSTEH